MLVRHFFAFLLIISALFLSFSCRSQAGNVVTIVTSDQFSGLDTMTTTGSDAAADRIRNLLFNSLVKKNDKFEYVGELSKDIQIDANNLTVAFVLHDNVKFHNGKDFTSADAKYTLDALFKAGGYKAASFYDSVPNPEAPTDPNQNLKKPHIVAMETPDTKTFVVKVARPALINQLLSNLVAVPIIPEGTIERQKTAPVGSGPFKFLRFDANSSLVELEANPNYWEGAPKIQKLNVKTIMDANALQAEFQSGRVDIAPNPTNFSSDTYNAVKQNPNLQVIQTDGSNVRYIGFNVSTKPADNVKFRQAIAFAIDREKIINELIGGQAKVAHSILPEGSWAFNAGTIYKYDPARAKQLLRESGYAGETVKFKIVGGNTAISQYSQVIQSSLKEVGINVEIEPLALSTLLAQLGQGQYQITTSQWVGGNQDPIFLRDLFDSAEFPPKGRNRSRYANTEFDKIVREAVDTTDKAKAAELYGKAQQIISDELPYITLWYPSNMVVATKRIGNIKINASGDWSFVKDLTLENN